jgi:hypothetical protein
MTPIPTLESLSADKLNACWPNAEVTISPPLVLSRPPVRPPKVHPRQPDYFDCLAACVEQHEWGNVLTQTLCLGNAAANVVWGNIGELGLERARERQAVGNTSFA